MRKIALSLAILVMAMAGVTSPASAQQSCQPGMNYIVYQYDGPPPGSPIVGYYVVFCNGHEQLYGAWGTHEDFQYCGCG